MRRLGLWHAAQTDGLARCNQQRSGLRGLRAVIPKASYCCPKAGCKLDATNRAGLARLGALCVPKGWRAGPLLFVIG